MVKDFLAQQAAAAEAAVAEPVTVPTKMVYVVNRQLKYGEQLSRADVRQIEWPAAAIPEGVFHEENTLFPENDPRPRFVLRTMERNEAVLTGKVTAPGEDAGLTSRLEKGMRAFAIKVDVASGVSGFLRPGDKVDIYWTGRVSGMDRNASGEVTKLIETGIQLIAVDQMANGDHSEAMIARTVTVAVNPQQVGALAQAQSTGRLALSLVGNLDDTVAEAIEVDQRSLLGLSEAPQISEERQKPKEEVCTIRTRRGAEVVETPIACK
ncbi:CpaB family protein [Pseudooceanicola batsensis HTCC2597]|uniref:CpaB family protein n=2 Tax=Pseudooceanicola batsensis TaxID=314255 RepID=A3TZ39_PSEBH|nr:CpaB family protein [Pseudooceanicola batsensis HTCC2597]